MTRPEPTFADTALDLREFFAAHAETGITIDAELCRGIELKLAELHEALLVAQPWWEAHIRAAFALPALPPRGSAARAALVRAAVALDSERRVLALPAIARRFTPPAFGDGREGPLDDGSAA
jgi:hypothetical protein